MHIISKAPVERYAVIRTAAQAARRRVSRECRQEYDTEKRIHELNARMPDGHRDAKAVAIATMVGRPEHQVKKLLRDRERGRSHVVCDGRID